MINKLKSELSSKGASLEDINYIIPCLHDGIEKSITALLQDKTEQYKNTIAIAEYLFRLPENKERNHELFAFIFVIFTHWQMITDEKPIIEEHVVEFVVNVKDVEFFKSIQEFLIASIIMKGNLLKEKEDYEITDIDVKFMVVFVINKIKNSLTDIQYKDMDKEDGFTSNILFKLPDNIKVRDYAIFVLFKISFIWWEKICITKPKYKGKESNWVATSISFIDCYKNPDDYLDIANEMKKNKKDGRFSTIHIDGNL